MADDFAVDFCVDCGAEIRPGKRRCFKCWDKRWEAILARDRAKKTEQESTDTSMAETEASGSSAR
jgi:NMD protein affecting ribosome stability and mRNA decay